MTACLARTLEPRRHARGSCELLGKSETGHTDQQLTRTEVQRRRNQTLASEGHRPCKTGQHPCSAVGRRRRRYSAPSPETTAIAVNKKVRRLALEVALYRQRLRTARLIVLDAFDGTGDSRPKQVAELCSLSLKCYRKGA